MHFNYTKDIAVFLTGPSINQLLDENEIEKIQKQFHTVSLSYSVVLPVFCNCDFYFVGDRSTVEWAYKLETRGWKNVRNNGEFSYLKRLGIIIGLDTMLPKGIDKSFYSITLNERKPVVISPSPEY